MIVPFFFISQTLSKSGNVFKLPHRIIFKAQWPDNLLPWRRKQYVLQNYK